MNDTLQAPDGPPVVGRDLWTRDGSHITLSNRMGTPGEDRDVVLTVKGPDNRHLRTTMDHDQMREMYDLSIWLRMAPHDPTPRARDVATSGATVHLEVVGGATLTISMVDGAGHPVASAVLDKTEQITFLGMLRTSMADLIGDLRATQTGTTPESD